MVFDRFRGVLDEAVGEGTHFRMPWVQTPNVMDIRTRPRTISSVTGTKGEPLLHKTCTACTLCIAGTIPWMALHHCAPAP